MNIDTRVRRLSRGVISGYLFPYGDAAHLVSAVGGKFYVTPKTEFIYSTQDSIPLLLAHASMVNGIGYGLRFGADEHGIIFEAALTPEGERWGMRRSSTERPRTIKQLLKALALYYSPDIKARLAADGYADSVMLLGASLVLDPAYPKGGFKS